MTKAPYAQVARRHRSGGGDRLYVSSEDRPRVRTVHAEVSHWPWPGDEGKGATRGK